MKKILLTFLSLSMMLSSFASDWNQISNGGPFPTGTFDKFAITSENKVLLSGVNSFSIALIYRYDTPFISANGNQGTMVSSYLGVNSSSIFMFDNIGWNAYETETSETRINKSTDLGNTWSLNEIFTGSLIDISFITADLGYLVTSQGLHKTIDGGVEWTQIEQVNINIQKLYMLSENLGYAINTDGDIYVTTNGGEQWTISYSNDTKNVKDIYFLDENNSWACGEQGLILKMNADGSWSDFSVPLTFALNTVHFIDDSLGFVAGQLGYIYKTTDGGETWEQNYQFSNISFADFQFNDEGQGLLCTSNGIFFEYCASQEYEANLVFCGPDMFGNQYIEESGFYSATFFDPSTGCDSILNANILVVNVSPVTLEFNVCESFEFQGFTYTQTSQFNVNEIDENGCSITTQYIYNVTMPNVQTEITNESYTVLTPGVEIQWGTCNDEFSPIDGATSSTFIPTQSGQYSAEVVQGACNIMLDCQQFIVSNINELTTEDISLYPNPTENILHIEAPMILENVEIVDVTGRIIFTQKTQQSRFTLDTLELESGQYIVNIRLNNNVISKKFIKH